MITKSINFDLQDQQGISEIEHPNVAKDIEYFFEDDQLYLIPEYVPGLSLSEFMKQQIQNLWFGNSFLKLLQFLTDRTDNKFAMKIWKEPTSWLFQIRTEKFQTSRYRIQHLACFLSRLQRFRWINLSNAVSDIWSFRVIIYAILMRKLLFRQRHKFHDFAFNSHLQSGSEDFRLQSPWNKSHKSTSDLHPYLSISHWAKRCSFSHVSH